MFFFFRRRGIYEVEFGFGLFLCFSFSIGLYIEGVFREFWMSGWVGE